MVLYEYKTKLSLLTTILPLVVKGNFVSQLSVTTSFGAELAPILPPPAPHFRHPIFFEDTAVQKAQEGVVGDVIKGSASLGGGVGHLRESKFYRTHVVKGFLGKHSWDFFGLFRQG